MNLPNFIIVGEARCGSTSLWSLLSKHPGIFFPGEKELHFFGSYDRFTPCGRYRKEGLEAYGRQFVDAREDQVCGEATPNYLSDPNSVAWIREALPDVKCIAILRDPVARAYSHYWQSVNRGWESEAFAKALELEESRIREQGANGFHDFAYFSRGLYGSTIARLFETVGRDNCLVLFLDELKQHRAATFSRLCRFLEIPEMGLEEREGSHKNKFDYPKSPALYRLQLQVGRTIERMLPAVRPLYKALGRATRRYRTTSAVAPMDPELEEELRGRYAESDASLKRLLGRDLPWDSAAAPSEAPPAAAGPSVRAEV